MKNETKNLVFFPFGMHTNIQSRPITLSDSTHVATNVIQVNITIYLLHCNVFTAFNVV